VIQQVHVEVVPPKSMRYRTVGDWLFLFPGCLMIRVADTGNWKYNILVAIHELIEVVLCRDAGVSAKQVDRFDLAHQDDEDPGTHPKAPYGKQHLIAMGVEMTLAAVMGVKWRVYEDVLDAIYYKIPKSKKPL
jgi:hypothetical protein